MFRPHVLSALGIFALFSWFSGFGLSMALAAGTGVGQPDTPAAGMRTEGQLLQLKTKKLRLAVRALDGSDPAVSYARGLRLEGALFIGGGAVALLGVILGGSVASLGSDEVASRGRLFVALSMPLGLGIVAAGVPGLLTGQRYLEWYASHRRPPSSLARLKLLNKWRRQYLRIRRNTGLLGSAFTGVATLFWGVGWSVADRQGLNGVVGSVGYDRGDALTTLGLGVVTAGLAAAGLISHLQLVGDEVGAHRALTPPALTLGGMPERSPEGISGYRVQGSLSFRF